jgi:tRNA modification GTPase
MKTIVALATAPMNGAIHIIRISGPDTFNIINQVATTHIQKRGYHIQRTKIVDKNKTLDDVLINTFVAPKSFTGEDLVEINCHGGYYLANKIIELLIQHGCVVALAGEFTQRAFMNNKLTLFEAESINNLINANSEKAIAIANHGLSKKVVQQLETFRHSLFELIGQVETNIDYPEFDDVPNVTVKQFKQRIEKFINWSQKIVNESSSLIPILEGINVVIVGKPNVGKSSLFNALLNENRAIVSKLPGTTRDVVNARINLNGVTINLLDTAGLRKTHRTVEKMGIDKSYESIQKADLIL